MKRVGHDGSVRERESCEELSVDFGEQDGRRRRRRAVQRGKPFEPFLVGGGAET